MGKKLYEKVIKYRKNNIKERIEQKKDNIVKKTIGKKNYIENKNYMEKEQYERLYKKKTILDDIERSDNTE